MPKVKKTYYIAVKNEPNGVGSYYTGFAQPTRERAASYWAEEHQVVAIEIDVNEEEGATSEQKE